MTASFLGELFRVPPAGPSSGIEEMWLHSCDAGSHSTASTATTEELPLTIAVHVCSGGFRWASCDVGSFPRLLPGRRR